DLPKSLRRGVQPAARRLAARQGDVELLRRQAVLEGALLLLLQRRLVRLRQAFLDLVGLLPVALALGGRHLAVVLQRPQLLALFAEVPAVPGAQARLVLAVGQLLLGAPLQLVQVSRHGVSYFASAGRCWRASSTSLVNASGSWTAMFASDLRS